MPVSEYCTTHAPVWSCVACALAMECPVIWAGPSTHRICGLLSHAPPIPGSSTVLVAYPGFCGVVEG